MTAAKDIARQLATEQSEDWLAGMMFAVAYPIEATLIRIALPTLARQELMMKARLLQQGWTR